ncbi:MAG: AAA family ATPase [Selenomonadaceae bacterium]|nr:AAA family ATPase [Selenomonadaceae bacterium]MBR6013971.1 AAA family ATPase [Selenomonadaceae bacterium]
MEHFISKIQIEKLRHLKNIEIFLSDNERQHLLLTGKNGSGKTSLLETLSDCLKAAVMKQKKNPQKIFNSEKFLRKVANNGVKINFNFADDLEKIFADGNFVLAYFPANRKANISLAKGVENVKLSNNYGLSDDPAQNLVKYMVHLKTQQAYARQENDSRVEIDIKNWFDRFENALKILLEDETIHLEYDYKNYNFLIHQVGRLPFGFNELSDGYSSVIQIMAGIMLRMEQNWLLKGTLSEYNFEGIVLIDELETHLHIELQRKILPFLTEFFPRVQFIISTHSPYILTSVSNATIFDLEKKVTFNDFSKYSIDNVAEAYFDSEDYSVKLEQKLAEYKSLIEKTNPTEEERIRRAELRSEFKNINGTLSARIKNEFEDIEARRKNGQN